MIQPHTAYSQLNCCEKFLHVITCGKKKFYKVDKLTAWEEAHMVHVRGTSILSQPAEEKK